MSTIVLKVGVAGHRRLKKDHLPIFRQKLKSIYSDIHQFFFNKASDKIHVRYISSFAEGADRLCIEPEVIPFECELAAIFPFPTEEYEKDFLPDESVVDSKNGTVSEFRQFLERVDLGWESEDSQEGIIELDGNPLRRTEAYNHCSQVLVEHSDLLVALYDGNLSKHVGTAVTVRKAMELGVPVIHVSTMEPGKVLLYPSYRFERADSELPYSRENLERVLRPLLPR